MTDCGTSKRKPYLSIGYADIELGRQLKGSAFLLYCYLSLRVGKNEGAWPSYQTITNDTGLAPATISKAIRDLVEYGVLTVEKRRKSGRQTSNFYTLLDPPDTSETEVYSTTQTSETEGRQTSVSEIGQTSETEEELSSVLEVTSDEYSPVKTSGADVLTTFMALYEILTGNPYVRARTTVPPALAKKIGRVETALAEFGVNGADGEEVLARWPRLRQKYPKATIHALPEHWHSLRDDEWAAYLEDIRHDDKPSKDPIANARALIERNRKLAGAGGDVGGVHDRPARDDRFRDREVGRDVPGLSDGRT